MCVANPKLILYAKLHPIPTNINHLPAHMNDLPTFLIDFNMAADEEGFALLFTNERRYF